MNPAKGASVRVLLIESQPDTVSVIKLFLSGIKNCELEISSDLNSSLVAIEEWEPSIVVLGHDLADVEKLKTLSAIHQNHPALPLIVSISQEGASMTNDYLKSGATDCIVKDKNFVPNLIRAIRKALTRIAERQSIILPSLTMAEQFAMDENLPDLVFIIDRDGSILHVNRAVSLFLGYGQNEVINRNFLDMLNREARPVFDKYLRCLEFDPNFRGSLAIIRKDAEECLFEVNCSMVEDMIYGVVRRDPASETIAVMSDAMEVREFQRPDVMTSAARSFFQESEEEEEMPARLGPYRIVTLLGAGAMGRVYKGFDEHLERFVAVKVISSALAVDTGYLERFQREARILASISHPNIALIYQFGATSKPPYFCMEFMPGGSLEELLQKKGQLDPDTAISYTMQVAIGLDEALKKSVVHLDIKPSNLMIAENDRIKIVDFGLAKTSREKDSSRLSIVGTPHYMAPEVGQGSIPDFRSDMYSLGVTLFRMVYGVMPFSGESLVEVLHDKLHKGMPERDSLDNRVPPVVYDIISRMMAKEPEKRYSRYADLIQDLEDARRSLHEPAVVDLMVPTGSAVLMRGPVFDQPFPEVLGAILRKNYSGKLTFSWIDLCKNVYVRNGKIVAVLSNQEGESFIDLLVRRNQLTGKKARVIQSNSIDLFLHYSSAMKEVSMEVRETIVADMNLLALQILQGVCSLLMGEFIFEEGDFSGQVALQLPANEILTRSVKEWIDLSTVRRRLLDGNCRIDRDPNYEKILSEINMKPADAFLLFRFDQSILFQDLFNISGLAEEEFFRLIYMFACIGVVSIHPHIMETASPPRSPKRQVAPKPIFQKVFPPPPSAKPTREVPQRSISGSASSPKTEIAHAAPEPPRPPAPQRQIDLGEYYFSCARQSFKNKNHWAAVEYCKKALEFQKHAAIYQLMGNAFATHPNFRHEALEAYKNAAGLAFNDATIYRDMADLYFSTGNMALAKMKYQEVLKFRKNDEHAAQRLEEIASRRKR